ncbi:hypothetical protein [Legionella bononiensis]|uniref:Competence protein A n=1 Tax=Legionella bononiensis TaxID=2793102 RepID=A0ABS1WBE0_9GAMM|nr:hypothetical protein [Legionella bononiensis]MBL7480967.1 hypothetical protein [Legionella bononiensis]MBL7526675.1 hypothetical protein [Legionella bononiensis]MBL7564082.1 hypothetical protein [Legionella bononiensis]
MFGLGKAKKPSRQLSCLLSEHGFSLVELEEGSSIRFCEHHYFPDPKPELFTKGISEAIERYSLIGLPCQVILSPGLYQLLLMDALEVPEQEMAKALRWHLKGMIDYPLNDIAVDTFMVPLHGAGGLRKRVFVAVTPQNELINKVELLKRCLLNISSISIAELALSQLLRRAPIDPESPTIVVSYDANVCRLHIYFKDSLYLSRALSISRSIIEPESTAIHDMVLEIQRSIDYCLIELKLPEPKKIFFTPSFYAAEDLFLRLKEELVKDVFLLDVNAYFKSEQKITPPVMAEAFYAIGGALMHLNGEK